MNERDIFIAALHEKDPAARAAFLAKACGDDRALREQVEQLLCEQMELGSFLERPAGPEPDAGPVTRTPTEATSSPLEGPGSVIGPYKLIQEIGEGGMGTVYMAQQTEPVKRLVAMKLIKPGMDSKQVLARLEAERQALALMDHPNIAKVLDAGQTPPTYAGGAQRPFFVMELVKGVPITRFCDQHRLTPRQRLELFVPVCQAIQHAHQKGIIHRDVKPSNVLVALYDDRPVPKVIDFGVAKATGQQLTEQTLHTAFGAVVGTLEYMSPEQASFNQLDIDTRSDIYSLGVLLYELLAGSPPFSRKDLERAGTLEMLRMIREEEPSKPSMKLSTAEGLPTLAANRGTEPAKLTKLLRGELDWIVMKALEKDRNRRYETANGLARDIERYLHDEPVQACPPSAWYKLKKFARRNKAALGMATLITVALLIAVAVLAVSNWRIAQEKHEKDEALDRATASELQAVTQAKRATIVADLLQQMLESANPEAAKGAGFTVRELLDTFSDRLEDQVHDQPEVEATIRSTIGRAYWRLGMLHAAEQHLARTLDLRRHGSTTEPALLAQALVDWAWVMSEQRKWTLAARALQEALTLYRKSTGAPAQILEALRVLQGVEEQQGHDDEVERIAQEALELAKALPEQQDPELACILHNLSRLRLHQGKLGEAERLGRESVQMHRRTQAKDHPELAWGLLELGRALAKQEKYADAEKQFKEALSIFRKHYPNDLHYGPQMVRGELVGVLRAQNKQSEADDLQRESAQRLRDSAQRILAQQEHLPDDYDALVQVLKSAHQVGDAEEVLRRAMKFYEKLAAAHPNEQGPREGLARSQYNLAGLLQEIGEKKEAEEVYRKAIAVHEKLVVEFWNVEYAARLLTCYDRLAALLKGNGRTQDAEKLRRQATELYEKLATANLKVPEYRLELADLYIQFGEWDKAAAAYTKVIELKPEHWDAWAKRGWMYSNMQQWSKAIEDYSKAIQLRAGAWGGWFGRGTAHSGLQQWDQAIADYSKAIELAPDEHAPWYWRGVAYANLKEPDKAMADLRQAIVKGFRDIAHMKYEPAFEPLRTREDFGKMLEQLQGKEKSQNSQLEKKAESALDKAALQQKQGQLHRDAGRFQEADTAFDEAVHAREKLAAESPQTAQYQWDLALALRERAMLLSNKLRKPKEAEELHRRAFGILERLVANHPNEPNYRVELGHSLWHLADLSASLGRMDEAEKLHRQALGVFEKLAADLPSVGFYRMEQGFSYWHLGWLMKNSGRPQDAEEPFRQASNVHAKLAADFPNELEYRTRLSRSYRELVGVLLPQGKHAEAEKILRQALTAGEKLVADSPTVPAYRDIVASSHSDLAGLLYTTRQFLEGEKEYRRAISIWEKLAAEFPKTADYTNRLALGHNNLAWLLATCSDPKFRDATQAVGSAKKAVELAPKEGTFWNTRGVSHYRAGSWKDAVAALEKSMEFRKGGDSFDWLFLAMACWQLGEKEKARTWYDQAVQWMDKNQPKDDELRRFRAEAAELLGTKDGMK
jgi:serine/threonine protein kinase/Flp pilus assembly protein TadD